MYNCYSFQETYPELTDRILFIHKYLEAKLQIYKDRRSRNEVAENVMMEKLSELLPNGRFDLTLSLITGFDVSESYCISNMK